MAENKINKLSINNQSYDLAGGAIVLDHQTATFQDVIDAAKNGPVYLKNIADSGGVVYYPVLAAVVSTISSSGNNESLILITISENAVDGEKVYFGSLSGPVEDMIIDHTPTKISPIDFPIYSNATDDEIGYPNNIVGKSILTKTSTVADYDQGGGIGIINVRKRDSDNMLECSAVTADGFNYLETTSESINYGTHQLLWKISPPYQYRFGLRFNYSGLYIIDESGELEDPSSDKHFIFKGYADKTYVLKSEISTLQETISNLQSTITQLQSTITELQGNALTELDRQTLDVIEGGTT